MAQEKNIGKILMKGQVECQTPLHIGSGSGDRSDLDVLLDESERPFIPASSFIGVLRHLVEPIAVVNNTQRAEFNNLWGYAEANEGHQSCFQCSDLICENQAPKIIVRDGIKIDNETGMVKDKGKYDFEIVERGTRFNFTMEFTFRKSNQEYVKKTAATIYTLLQTGETQIGAKTNSGLGQVSFAPGSLNIYMFDFTKKSDVLNWLTRNFKQQSLIKGESLGEAFNITNDTFYINATLQLQNSVLIRSYTEDPKLPDATHIKSLDDWILTGTSLKGAIRARAERILNTLEKSENIARNLFGYVDTDTLSKNAKKGKIRIKETVLPKFIAEIQTRIKIDRFTGGTIETALFDSMPLFANFNDKVLSIKIFVKNCTLAEAGLLLLVLKDLWTGDLAVGGEKNIGRGVFTGVSASIKWADEPGLMLEKDFAKLDPITKDKLESFVKALNSEN